jgi:anti-sigma regulatory factor (Ser/Thr protein kinase)
VVPVEKTVTSTALVLPFEVDSARTARRRLGAELRKAGVAAEDVHDALLILSELVGNALRHARPLSTGSLHVGWTRGSTALELSVTDGGGPTLPRPVEAGGSDGGRGLAIVDDLTRVWGVSRREGSTTVYAVLPLDRAGRLGTSRPAEGRQ